MQIITDGEWVVCARKEALCKDNDPPSLTTICACPIPPDPSEIARDANIFMKFLLATLDRTPSQPFGT